MGLDIRLAIGSFFSAVGLLLGIFGLLSPRVIYTRSLGIDVNLIWGVVLLIFGVVMITLALRARKAARRKASDNGCCAETVSGRTE